MSQLQSQAQDQPDAYNHADSRNQPQIINGIQVQNDCNPQGSTQTRLDGNAEDFHFFSQFPLELQRKIWEFAAIPHYRVIEVETKFTRIQVEPSGHRVSVWHNQITSPCYPHALFETCRESRHIAIARYDHNKDGKVSTPPPEKCNIPHRLYYNMDNDILWINDDPLLKTVSEENFDTQLYPIHDAQFRIVAIDLEKFFPKFFAQPQLSVSHGDFVYLSDFISNLLIYTNPVMKKVYLVYSRVNQGHLVTGILYSFQEFIEADVEINKDYFDSIMALKGLKGQPWRWPVVEAILKADLFEGTRDSRNNIILK